MFETVALLGLSCAFNPVLIAVVLLTLASERPKRMLGAYTAGAFTWSVGLGIGVVAVATDAEVFGSSSSPSRPVADLVLGVLLLVGAVWYATGRAEARKARRAALAEAEKAKDGGPQKPPLAERLLSGPPALAFFAGVVLNFPSVRYIAAMKEIVVADVVERQQVLAILIFNLLMLSPAIVPLAFLSFRPEETKVTLERLDAWMRRNSRVLISGVLGVLGLYLSAKGIVGLA
jgi:Sap-like sulfolipid-1-addressing protein